ncbi:hypothetical protein QR685DRAFT_177349 [Neurospora intermedia]|uniref:Uncharacterized protein n=1 Tax=Neurospora intermedia TaxID=5142 RepID=A0ABR3DMG7_NEUIN
MVPWRAWAGFKLVDGIDGGPNGGDNTQSSSEVKIKTLMREITSFQDRSSDSASDTGVLFCSLQAGAIHLDTAAQLILSLYFPFVFFFFFYFFRFTTPVPSLTHFASPTRPLWTRYKVALASVPCHIDLDSPHSSVIRPLATAHYFQVDLVQGVELGAGCSSIRTAAAVILLGLLRTRKDIGRNKEGTIGRHAFFPPLPFFLSTVPSSSRAEIFLHRGQDKVFCSISYIFCKVPSLLLNMDLIFLQRAVGSG